MGIHSKADQWYFEEVDIYLSKLDKFDSYITRAEECLMMWSAIPITGSLAGCLKLSLGLIQTISALALSTLTAGFALFELDALSSALFLKSWEYLKHGVANIGSSIFEIIPIVATIAFAVRFAKGVIIFGGNENKPDVYIDNHQELHFYSYHSQIIENGQLKSRSKAFEPIPLTEAIRMGVVNDDLQITNLSKLPQKA